MPWSETISPGLPRRSISAESSRATRRPEIDVSGIAARHSLVTSSTMLRMRKAAAAGELVVDEIQRPARVGFCLHEDRRPRSDGASPGSPLSHGEAFLAVEAINAVEPGPLALSAQQDEEAPIAKPAALVREIAELSSQGRVGRAA